MSIVSRALADRFADARTAINTKYQIAAFLDSKGIHTENNRQICCPFHDDSTPSFSVDTENNVWKCFGCQDGGHFMDLWIRYQQQYENHTYNIYEAVETILNQDIALQQDLGFKSIYKDSEISFDLFKEAEGTNQFDFDKVLSSRPEIKKVSTDSLQQVVTRLQNADTDRIIEFIADCENGASEAQLISKYYKEQDTSVEDYIQQLVAPTDDAELTHLFMEALND